MKCQINIMGIAPQHSSEKFIILSDITFFAIFHCLNYREYHSI